MPVPRTRLQSGMIYFRVHLNSSKIKPTENSARFSSPALLNYYNFDLSLVEVRGEISNRNRGVRLDARAGARPIGGMSKANCREISEMVEPRGNSGIHKKSNKISWLHTRYWPYV